MKNIRNKRKKRKKRKKEKKSNKGIMNSFFVVLSIIFPFFIKRTSSFSSCRDDIPSACGNGYSYNNFNNFNQKQQEFGYICPHLMMLSDNMTMAVKEDGLHDNFVYAVAGGSGDGECGKCYQVQILDAERKWRPDFPFLIVQIINSGYDVLGGQLDLFMGGGGFGYFTSCNSDCRQNYCQGGPCQEGMYEGKFNDWVDAQYEDPNRCYSGGIKWVEDVEEGVLEEKCSRLSNFKDNTLTQSCVRTNQQYFHQNFVSSKSTRVQCPEQFYSLTNLHRTDDQNYPFPSPSLYLDKSCQGDRTQGHYCITTMQDCCKASCSWSNKVESYFLDENKPCVYTCNRKGDILE